VLHSVSNVRSTDGGVTRANVSGPNNANGAHIMSLSHF
jgi:hypothetical protein